VPIYEPGLEKLVDDNLERLTFTTSYDELLDACRILFVAVDTPPSPSGDADLSRVRRVIDRIADDNGEHLVVMKSTVPVGTGGHMLHLLRERGASGVRYVSNPEFLREGAAIQDFLEPDRIIIGAGSPQDGEEVADLYRGIDTTVVHTSVPTAEMIKYASNAFLATKISFINEIANVCEGVGADVRTVARGMGLDHRIGPHFLQAGIGYGGSCFPKDVQALKQLAGNSGYHFQLLNAVIEVNHLQKRRVVAKLKQRLGSLHGLNMALLGLTFKPNTDDLREAASIVLAARLQGEGARVAAYDPMVPAGIHDQFPGVTICATPLDALRHADAAILVTDWAELERLDWSQALQVMRRPLVLDGRNCLDADALRAIGFDYQGVGTAQVAAEAAAAPSGR
jgi:UDPglucose 6-dehydrogenase